MSVCLSARRRQGRRTRACECRVHGHVVHTDGRLRRSSRWKNRVMSVGHAMLGTESTRIDIPLSTPTPAGKETKMTATQSTSMSRSSSTISRRAVHEYDARQLCFPALIKELSQKPHLPTSIHVRNLLLSGLASRENASASDVADNAQTQCPSESQRSDALWEQLTSYQPAIQVAVLGDAPRSILCGNARSTDAATGDGDGTRPWAVAILKSSVFRQKGDILSYLRRPDFSIWLSSESHLAEEQLARDNKATDNLDSESLELFKFVVGDWLPRAHEHFQRDLFDDFEEEEGEPKRDALRTEAGTDADGGGSEVNVLAFAMENNISDALLQWGKEPGSKVKVDWHATYGTLQRYEKDSSAKETEGEMVGSGGRWSLEKLGEESVRVVLDSNKLAFPKSHLLRKPFLTCLVRDHRGPDPSSESHSNIITPNNDYATDQAKGRAAGWVYTHEDLSLASLHVPPPYRRLTPRTEGVPSVGRLLMDVMSARISRHQERILRQVGLDLDLDGDSLGPQARPVTADVEIDNAASWQFYLRTGFVPVARHTWLGLRVVA